MVHGVAEERDEPGAPGGGSAHGWRMGARRSSARPTSALQLVEGLARRPPRRHRRGPDAVARARRSPRGEVAQESDLRSRPRGARRRRGGRGPSPARGRPTPPVSGRRGRVRWPARSSPARRATRHRLRRGRAPPPRPPSPPSRPARATSRGAPAPPRASASAIGERQVLPVQTKRMLKVAVAGPVVPRSFSMAIASLAGGQRASAAAPGARERPPRCSRSSGRVTFRFSAAPCTTRTGTP